MSTGFCIAAGVLGIKPGPVSERPRTERLVSLLIACCGQLEYTRLCVPSLLRSLRQPHEFLFLDADSFDGTAEYLAGIADALPVRVELVPVTHPGTPGAPKGSEVLQIHGEYVVLMNNDTVVSEGWLERLVEISTLNPGVGLVAPMSNYAPPPLLVEQMPFRLNSEEGSQEQIAKVNRFAQEWKASRRGQWSEVERVGGGCVLVKREVLQALGLFPTRTPLGCFDLEALGQRVRQAGFRLAVCAEAFVYSFGCRNPVRA